MLLFSSKIYLLNVSNSSAFPFILLFCFCSSAIHEFPRDVFTNQERAEGAVGLHVLCVSFSCFSLRFLLTCDFFCVPALPLVLFRSRFSLKLKVLEGLLPLQRLIASGGSCSWADVPADGQLPGHGAPCSLSGPVPVHPPPLLLCCRKLSVGSLVISHFRFLLVLCMVVVSSPVFCL